MTTVYPSRRPHLCLLILGLVAGSPSSAHAQTEPADPLTLLEQGVQDTDPQTAAHAEIIANQRRHLMKLDEDPAARARLIAKTAALAETLTNAQLKEAVQRGVDRLLQYAQSKGEYSALTTVDQRPWKSFAGDQAVGVVAITAQALLEAGRFTGDARLRPFSPELTPLLRWLIAAHSNQVYSTAIQGCALSLLPPRPEVVKALERIRNDLTRAMRDDGSFGYSVRKSDYWDNSNTQYALLGMWAIGDAGIEIPPKFWLAQDAHWRDSQASSGGWAYRTPDNGFAADGKILAGIPIPSLTAAGLASMFVTLDHLSAGTRERSQDRALQSGLTAFSSDFVDNLAALSTDLYYTYNVQRVGVASGYKYINHINWFRRGAAALLGAQQSDGAWTYGYSTIVGSAYAILFLTHGGSPVIFNKLQYPGPWDSLPRDDANLTARISHTLEVPLNWQVISVDTDPTDWLDAPVLLITGNGDPHFTDDDLKRLGAYINAGGIIFSVADSSDTAFTEAIEKAAVRATGNQYPLRALPADHPLYSLYRKAKKPAGLVGISNGVRELWIHSPAPLAAAWQNLAYEETDAWDIPENLYVYATGKNRPRDRLDTLAVPTPADSSSRKIALACLTYEGNSDPEPGAWPRLGKILRRDADVQLTLQTVDIPHLDSRVTPIAHLTGTDRLVLPDASVAALQAYLHSGGTLLADATGGNDAFAQSFLALAHRLAPDSQIDILPPTSPLFAGGIPGMVPIDPNRADYRKATPTGRRPARPEIWVWKINGRDAIFFSPLDLTCGLLGTDTWGIAGYTPDLAQQLARNLVLYAAAAVPATSTAPPAP